MRLETPVVLSGQRLVVVDIEGNGGWPPEIVEIAVLPVDDVISRDELSVWLVRPRTPITSAVTRRVHGIRNSDVASKPQWTDIAEEVSALLSGRILVAHNASVELRILRQHLPEYCPALVLDTLRLARLVWPGLNEGHGLDALITYARITAAQGLGRRHRAGYDTWMTAALLTTLADQAGLSWPDLVRAAALPDTGSRRDLPPAQDGLW